jgi:26S proteasome regulatory subunit N9
MDYIESKRDAYPELAAEFDNLGSLFAKKLWHQLSVALEEFLKTPKLKQADVVELYKEFIVSFEARLSQVRFASIVSTIGRSYGDPAQAVEFYETILKSRQRLGPEAAMCVDMDIAMAKIQMGFHDEVKIILEAAKENLPGISSTETIVFSKYYGALSEYRKVIGPPQEFYKAALMFLSYSPMEDMSPDQKITLATDMALASTTGENIYNFGEVLATPILQALEGTPNAWLFDLVIHLNAGDVDKFNSLVDAHRDQYFAQPALAQRHEDVKKKIVLLSLMNLVFERHSHDRCIPFSDIATRTRLPMEQVEWVLMRAMSLGLIKGIIDQVESTVEVSWVQPRVLNKEQLKLLSAQLESWSARVKSTLVTVEDQTPELYV